MTQPASIETVVNAQVWQASNYRHFNAYYRPDLYGCGCVRWKPPEPTLEERIANSSITELVLASEDLSSPKVASLAIAEIARRLKAEYENGAT